MTRAEGGAGWLGVGWLGVGLGRRLDSGGLVEGAGRGLLVGGADLGGAVVGGGLLMRAGPVVVGCGAADVLALGPLVGGEPLGDEPLGRGPLSVPVPVRRPGARAE